jgi:hypothetical protein
LSLSRPTSSGGGSSGSPAYPPTSPNLPSRQSFAAAAISSGVLATKVAERQQPPHGHRADRRGARAREFKTISRDRAHGHL